MGTTAPPVTVIVPYRAGQPDRARVAWWVLKRYRTLHPDWELLIVDRDGPWSKARSVNLGAAESVGDVLVIADADVLTSQAWLDSAVLCVQGGAPWAVPHSCVYRLTRDVTATVVAGPVAIETHQPACADLTRDPYLGILGGGLLVVSRAAFDSVRGMDERFVGWAGEDTSFGWALQTIAGPPVRGDGNLWHLWHPMDAKNPNLGANRRLESRYQRAFRVPARMRALIDEPQG